MTQLLYKWLKSDCGAPIGSGKWTKGRWRSVECNLVPCQNGLHLARESDLVHYISERLWIAEADMSEVVECADKVVVRWARVIERVETIDDGTLRAFAADCADRVVHLTGPDPRYVNAIAVARSFARQQATAEELDAARTAAYAAAADAAAYAANAAAWAAASRDKAAAYAAKAAAYAAKAAAYAANAAAWAAAYAADAAADAADAADADAYAAKKAAYAAANARLLQYVEHGSDAMDMPWPVTPAWPHMERTL